MNVEPTNRPGIFRFRFGGGGWIWLCGWLLAAGFVVWHATLVDRYLDRVSATRFTADSIETPLARVPQSFAPDGQMWIRQSLDLEESGAARLRTSTLDNAPDGRPVYWNSGWAWWLKTCGHARQSLTKESFATALENAAFWANLPVFLVVMSVASLWVWRRWGGPAGAVMAVSLAGHRGFYEGFYPGYSDHHGLISASVLGVVLGVGMAGGGWWRRAEAPGISLLPKSGAEVMRAMTVSAVCGALGLWVSAASLVVTIAFAGIGGLLGVLVAGGSASGDGVTGAGVAWRRWGRVGGAMSLGFYLLENFPDRLGWRLEANHPLYSLAWWGAGEVIGAVIEWKEHRRPLKWILVRAGGWGSLVLGAPLALGIKGAMVFSPLAPFMRRIHASIHEFQPLAVAMERSGWRTYADELAIMAVLAVLGGVWVASKPPRAERRLAVCLGGVALAATLLAWMQNRWLLTASAPQVCLALFLMLGVMARLRPISKCFAMAALCGLLYLPGPWMLARERLLVERVRDVQLGETVQLLYRDIAGALLKSGAGKDSILLANPNASVGVGYYGRLRTIGTLYWENSDGLRKAAEMLCAQDDSEAAARVYASGVTHVVLISIYDFMSEYAQALDGGRGGGENVNGMFGRRVLNEDIVPVWLKPLNYQVPAQLRSLGIRAGVFEVDFTAPVSVAHERIGLYQLSRGKIGLAESSFMAALAADAKRPEPWFLQGGLLLATGRSKEAVSFITAGIERAPASERERLIQSAANLFARKDATTQAKVFSDMLKKESLPAAR